MSHTLSLLILKNSILENLCCSQLLQLLIIKMLTKLFTRFTNKQIQYFTNWQTAEKQCDSYDNEAVLKTFANAALAVGRGDAIYDLDGKTFRRFSENAHLVAALRHVSAAEGQFNVLDFGGALGNIYRQHRWFLSNFNDFIWCVVDKEGFVETGRRLFTSHKLKFETTIPQAVKSYKPNIAVMSNTLQRMERPFDLLNELVEADIPYLFIDRTPVITSLDNRITCSTYPAVSAETAFPSWHFSEEAFKAALQKKYRIITEFNADDKNLNTRHMGFFCQKI
jgi:putative methyltransferase (TIGR04325 family)